jgi:thiamine-monophosphate kinase
MHEAEFLLFLEEKFSFSRGKGIGDDASTVRKGDCYQVITQDLLIENVHFDMDYYSIDEVALKSLAVNLSDIAAMGGVPQYFYLGLGFPKRLHGNLLLTFFESLKKGCQKWKIELAGGDFSTSSEIFISITMVGEAHAPVFRDNAKTGDLIGITNVTGESAIGLNLLKQGIQEGYMVKKHKVPIPELKGGSILASYVNAMIDVSDGLLIDLKRILTASGKGAEIDYEKIPVTVEMKRTCQRYNLDLKEMVLAGGEDYVLLFAISPEQEQQLKKNNFKYFIIGKINNNRERIRLKDGGKLISPPDTGYDHFK